MAQDYYTILTNAGLAYEAACKANQVPIKLTHFAVGDGNGAAYNPGPDATALRRETHRQPINSLLQDEANPSWLMADTLVADDVGGWTIREVGIYTDTGILYAIGKYPDSVKPILAQGSGKQFYVRAIFQTSNATSVTLLIDNSVVMATRAFVLDHVKAELARLDGKNSVKVATTANLGALSGLLTVDGLLLAAGDRVLVKDQADATTNGIYVVAAGAWGRATDADASIEVTPGLLVAIEQGAINGDSIWQLVTDAPVTLGTTGLVFEIAAGPSGVVAGTYRSVTVDKRGRVSGGSNPTTLAGYGITDAVSASAEASQAEAEAGAAPGKWMSPLRVKQAIAAQVQGTAPATIQAFATNTPPPGWLKANGAAVSRATYSALFAALVTAAGFTPQTFTVTLATPGVFTKVAHGLQHGARVRLATTGTLPTGLSTTTDYFVEVINADTFYLSLTLMGARIATSGAQAGVHTFLQSWFGLGDGVTTFNLPDLRGEFLRGWDDGRGVDVGRLFGTTQLDDLKSHDHVAGSYGGAYGSGATAYGGVGMPAGADKVWTNTKATGGDETRPRNVAVLVCIKY